MESNERAQAERLRTVLDRGDGRVTRAQSERALEALRGGTDAASVQATLLNAGAFSTIESAQAYVQRLVKIVRKEQSFSPASFVVGAFLSAFGAAEIFFLSFGLEIPFFQRQLPLWLVVLLIGIGVMVQEALVGAKVLRRRPIDLAKELSGLFLGRSDLPHM